MTWDGFRWQEFFEEAVLSKRISEKDAGVDKVELVTKKYWRENRRSRAT